MGRALVLALLCAPGLAAAEAEPSPRSGLILEAELGLAVMNATTFLGDQVDVAGATVTGHLGGFLSPRTSLLILAGAAGGETDDAVGELISVSELHLGVAGRFWMTPRLWAELTASTSRLVVRESLGSESSVPGARLALAGGFTVYEGQQLNLDGRVGVSAGGYGSDGESSTLWLAVGLTNR